MKVKTKEQLELDYAKEAKACVVVLLIGILWLSIILEPAVLWRSVHIMKRTKDQTTHNIAKGCAIVSGVITGLCALAILLAVVA